jgi:hypothetical protein
MKENASNPRQQQAAGRYRQCYWEKSQQRKIFENLD